MESLFQIPPLCFLRLGRYLPARGGNEEAEDRLGLTNLDALDCGSLCPKCLVSLKFSTLSKTSKALRHLSQLLFDQPAEFPLADLEDLARLCIERRVGVGDAGVVQADAALLDEAAGL